MDEYHEWQNRPLKDTYAIVYLDAIYLKIRENGMVTNRAVYITIGIDEQGHKSILAIKIGENEGAKFWLTFLNELKNRGVKDILIAVVDGLKGFPEALTTAFPETTVQTCIVHLMRNSIASSSYKDRRNLAAALKPIYRADNADHAEALLTEFEDSELGQKYPYVVSAWRQRWAHIIPFFAFSPLIRQAIYTTNTIESLNASIRRAVQKRGHFTSIGAARTPKM